MNYNYNFERTGGTKFWNYFLLVFFTALVVGVSVPVVLWTYVDRHKKLENAFTIDEPLVTGNDLVINNAGLFPTVDPSRSIDVLVTLHNFVAKSNDLELELIAVNSAFGANMTNDYISFPNWFSLLVITYPTSTTLTNQHQFTFRFDPALTQADIDFILNIDHYQYNYQFRVSSIYYRIHHDFDVPVQFIE